MKQHSTKVFRDIVNALGSFIQSLFLVPNTGNTSATTNQTGKRFFAFLLKVISSYFLIIVDNYLKKSQISILGAVLKINLALVKVEAKNRDKIIVILCQFF